MLDDDVRPGDLLQGTVSGKFYLVIEIRRSGEKYTWLKSLYVAGEDNVHFEWLAYHSGVYKIIQRTP